MSPEHEGKSDRLTLDSVTRQATETLFKHGEHIPTLIVEGSLETAIFGLVDLADTHEARALQMATLGFSLARRPEIGVPEQAFFISEAWTSIGKEGSGPVVPPSEDPDRKEVLIIASLIPGTKRAGMVLMEMVRDPQGELRELKPLPMPGGGELSVESSLLSAFYEGYLLGQAGRDR